MTTEPMSAERLAEITAREAAATKGPWSTYDTGDGVDIAADLVDTGVGYTARREIAEVLNGPVDKDPAHIEWDSDEDYAQTVADAEFIAKAREDVPALLAENERLRSELATQRAATLREAAALCRANDAAVPTASDAARTAAAEILAGAAAGTLGPIRDCTVDGDIVRFRIRPTTLTEWEQWLDVLEVPAGRVTSHGGYTTAHGRWGTTEVVLVGYGVGLMQTAQLRAELAERSTGGAR